MPDILLINQRPTDVVESILKREPKVVGIGVYIWNVSQSLQVVGDLKRIRPELPIVVGGSEVSYELAEQEIVELADYVVTGEADLAFAELCGQLLSGRRPAFKIIPSPLPHFGQISLPYDLYDERDIAHRVLYVEASRGCPFECEFCLSSLDIPVRNVPLNPFGTSIEVGTLPLDRFPDKARGSRIFKS